MGGGEGIMKASEGYSESGREGQDELMNASVGLYVCTFLVPGRVSSASGRVLP